MCLGVDRSTECRVSSLSHTSSYLLTFGTCKSARIAQLGKAYTPPHSHSSQREREEWFRREERKKVVMGGGAVGQGGAAKK